MPLPFKPWILQRRMARPGGAAAAEPVLGLAANWRQFSLLVIVNAFVGAMVGQERAVLPLIARDDFAIASSSAVAAFIAAFGLAKAIGNLVAGSVAETAGRRRVLLTGWLFGLPVPFIIGFAPDWWWIVAGNLLLGVNQALAWSMTIVMKIDLVGPRQRGLALGLNEFAGYFAVGVAAWGAAWLGASVGGRPAAFALGTSIAVAGLLVTALFVRDTLGHARLEERGAGDGAPSLTFREVFGQVSWSNRTLFGCSQAGLVNNLNDALAWGLLPLFFAASGLDLGQIGVLAAAYPVIWSIVQIGAGALSDRIGRKALIVLGLGLQAGALVGIGLGDGFSTWLAWTVVYGLGTGFAYPTLLAAVADAAHPSWRASALGVYRFWRDGGFVVGALAAGVLADAFGGAAAILAVAGVTLLSSGIALASLREGRAVDGHMGRT